MKEKKTESEKKDVGPTKKPTTLHDDSDSDKKAKVIKKVEEISTSAVNHETPNTEDSLESQIEKNSISPLESDAGNESPMVITPKLFKESIHEAIRQFAERMKLAGR